VEQVIHQTVQVGQTVATEHRAEVRTVAAVVAATGVAAAEAAVLQTTAPEAVALDMFTAVHVAALQ
jgi:hypothetical protein